MDIAKLRKNLYRLAIVCLLLAVVVFAINYVAFHFLTDDGFTTVWQPEPGKPFVTNLIGMLGADLVFASIISALCGKVLLKKEK